MRGGSGTAATSKMERFVTIVTKRSILDVAAVLDPPLINSWDRIRFEKFMIIKSQERIPFLMSFQKMLQVTFFVTIALTSKL